MNNQNTTQGYSIANKDEFKMEVVSLLNKIGNQINGKANNFKTNHVIPTKKIATKLGILKIHEFKLNEILLMLDDIDTAEWIEYKPDFKKDFEAAYEAFQPSVVK